MAVALAEITALELRPVVRRIEGREALDTVHHVRSDCGRFFRDALVTGRAERDLSADLRGALPPIKQDHSASISELASVGKLMHAIEVFRGAGHIERGLQSHQAPQ